MPVPRDPCAWFVPWFVPLVRAASGAAALAAKPSHAELPSLIREAGESAETGGPRALFVAPPGAARSAAPRTAMGRPSILSRLRHPERQRSVCRPSAIRVYPCSSVACLIPSLLLRALSA